MLRFSSLMALLFIVAGCGGKATENGSALDGGTGDAAEDDSPSGADALSKPWSPFCPASAPAMGSSCVNKPTPLGDLQCEYACGEVFACADGTWGGGIGNELCPSGPNPPGCPAKLSTIAPDSACTAVDDTCVYATGICSCQGPADPTPDAGATWWCGPGPGCPMPRPRLGSACPSEGRVCGYEECGDTEECQGGVWREAPVACGG